MRYGWRKTRGGAFVRCDAPGPPAWLDEMGERRKRSIKGKDEPAPSGPHDDGAKDVVLCGTMEEGQGDHEPGSPSQVSGSTATVD